MTIRRVSSELFAKKVFVPFSTNAREEVKKDYARINTETLSNVLYSFQSGSVQLTGSQRIIRKKIFELWSAF